MLILIWSSVFNSVIVSSQHQDPNKLMRAETRWTSTNANGSEWCKYCCCRSCQWWWAPDWRIIKLWLLQTLSSTWTTSPVPGVWRNTSLSSVRTLQSTTNTSAGWDRDGLPTPSSSAACAASCTILNQSPGSILISRSGGVRPRPAPTPPGQTHGLLIRYNYNFHIKICDQNLKT